MAQLCVQRKRRHLCQQQSHCSLKQRVMVLKRKTLRELNSTDCRVRKICRTWKIEFQDVKSLPEKRRRASTMSGNHFHKFLKRANKTAQSAPKMGDSKKKARAARPHSPNEQHCPTFGFPCLHGAMATERHPKRCPAPRWVRISLADASGESKGREERISPAPFLAPTFTPILLHMHDF